MNKKLLILGTRGIPASHGGFETFAENIASYLVKKGWQVTVYCQESLEGCDSILESSWEGVRRIHIPVKGTSAKATVLFDFLCVKHAVNQPGLVLTLGYNTALFNLMFRIVGKKNLINMDGIEWRRDKWAWYEKVWLYLNERAGCLIGHHLIADHPEIKKHLKTRVRQQKITMIPYGARQVDVADVRALSAYSLTPKTYSLVIARPEPENSILEIVRGFSSKERNHTLVILGRYDESNSYHASVLAAASNEVKFVGAVYEYGVLDSLRFYASLYVHGHTVGGTNPSLIEALGAGQPILAHNNRFNRWVAGEGASYFVNEKDCVRCFDELIGNGNVNRLALMSSYSRNRFNQLFTWPNILKQYEKLLLQWV